MNWFHISFYPHFLINLSLSFSLLDHELLLLDVADFHELVWGVEKIGLRMPDELSFRGCWRESESFNCS